MEAAIQKELVARVHKGQPTCILQPFTNFNLTDSSVLVHNWSIIGKILTEVLKCHEKYKILVYWRLEALILCSRSCTTFAPVTDCMWCVVLQMTGGFEASNHTRCGCLLEW